MISGNVFSSNRGLHRVPAILLWCGMVLLCPAHPSHPLGPVDYPVVAGFENFFIQEDAEEYLARGGELLLSELNCVGCHAPNTKALADRIPGKTGPRLGGVGSRLRPDDMRLLIRNPRQVKRGTTMPSLFAGPDRDPEVIEALTHYLASKTVREEVYPKGDVERGKEIYHAVGCVACHSMEEDYRPKRLSPGMEPELPGFPSVPLALCYLYDENSLAAFLHLPLETRPAGRMPDMKLEEQEAADIAAYLKENFPEPEGAEEFEINDGLVERGRKAFLENRCASCHEAGEDVDPTLAPVARALEELNLESK